MKSKAEKSTKEKLEDYIQDVQTWKGKQEEFDWKIYEQHKKNIKKLCVDDWDLYDWAINKLSDKLGI